MENYIRCIKDDMKDFGELSKYYYFHVAVQLFNTLDTEEEFNSQILILSQGSKMQNLEYLTETTIFNNITINNYRIKKLTIKVFRSEACLSDPTSMQLGIVYTTGSYAYLKFEL